MAVATANILAGLYTHLKGDSTFNTAMGGDATTAGRIWYGQAKPEETLPYCVVFMVDGDDFDTFSNDGISMRMQVTLYGTEAAGPTAVAANMDLLLTRLNGVRFTATGHAMMTSELDILRGPFIDDQAWRMDADFLIRGRVS